MPVRCVSTDRWHEVPTRMRTYQAIFLAMRIPLRAGIAEAGRRLIILHGLLQVPWFPRPGPVETGVAVVRVYLHSRRVVQYRLVLIPFEGVRKAPHEIEPSSSAGSSPDGLRVIGNGLIIVCPSSDKDTRAPPGAPDLLGA